MIFYQKSQVIFGRKLPSSHQGIFKKPRGRKWLPRNSYKRFLIRNHLEGARSDFHPKNSFGRKSPSWADLNQKSFGRKSDGKSSWVELSPALDFSRHIESGGLFAPVTYFFHSFPLLHVSGSWWWRFWQLAVGYLSLDNSSRRWNLFSFADKETQFGICRQQQVQIWRNQVWHLKTAAGLDLKIFCNQVWLLMTTADHGEGFCKQQVWHLKTAAGPAEDFVQAAENWQVS